MKWRKRLTTNKTSHIQREKRLLLVSKVPPSMHPLCPSSFLCASPSPPSLLPLSSPPLFFLCLSASSPWQDLVLCDAIRDTRQRRRHITVSAFDSWHWHNYILACAAPVTTSDRNGEKMRSGNPTYICSAEYPICCAQRAMPRCIVTATN